MHTLLLTFDTEQERKEFLELINDAANRLEVLGAQNEIQAMWQPRLKKLLETATLDVSTEAGTCNCNGNCGKKEDDTYALFVSGRKMNEGKLSEIQKQFNQELSQHNGTVQIRIQREHGWVVVRQRLKK